MANCKPGCKCKRHNPTHRSNCMCPKCYGRRHPKRPKYVEAQHQLPNVVDLDAKRDIKHKSGFGRRDDVCVCGHVEARHDPFGCKTCANRMEDRVSGAKPCHQYRSRYGYTNRADSGTYEREVRDEGFIKHIGELATCSACWTVVKLGETNTLTSVISARAHLQICTARVRASKENRRPNRASDVG